MKTTREILEILRCNIINSVEDSTIDPPEELRRQREFIDTALLALKEMVLAKKEMIFENDTQEDFKGIWNQAIAEVARLFEEDSNCYHNNDKTA